ncbi:hypothetical protein SAMN03159401_3537 [Klebsiella quasipneumoniae]|nr:hypothetical protein SAMN03159401_3537 [Klebsiella quasipneumoniae]
MLKARFARALANLLRLSRHSIVGFLRAPRSHSYLCSRGLANSPPRCDLKYFGDTNLVFSTVAALATRVHPGHIVIYAPGDSLACRLATIEKP